MNTKLNVVQKCLWPVCLVALFIMGILSLDCNLLHVHLHRVTWRNLRLLGSMSNSFPVECLRENKAFEFPRKILSYNQTMKGDIKEVFYEMSMLAFNIFTQPTFQCTWEEERLVQIQTGLNQQVHYLKQCLEGEEKENEDMKEMEEDERKYLGATVLQLKSLELRRYFHKIGSFLKDKKYSHCAWEIVRVEIRRCFSYFKKFTALFRSK
ncbi:interferon kappa [Rhynchonycteris naso]